MYVPVSESCVTETVAETEWWWRWWRKVMSMISVRARRTCQHPIDYAVASEILLAAVATKRHHIECRHAQFSAVCHTIDSNLPRLCSPPTDTRVAGRIKASKYVLVARSSMLPLDHCELQCAHYRKYVKANVNVIPSVRIIITQYAG